MSSSPKMSTQERVDMYLLKSRQSRTPLILTLEAGIDFLNHQQFLATGKGFHLCGCRFLSSEIVGDSKWLQLDGSECNHTPCGRTRRLCRCKLCWSITFAELGQLEPETPPLNTAQQRQEELEELNSRFRL